MQRWEACSRSACMRVCAYSSTDFPGVVRYSLKSAIAPSSGQDSRACATLKGSRRCVLRGVGCEGEQLDDTSASGVAGARSAVPVQACVFIVATCWDLRLLTRIHVSKSVASLLYESRLILERWLEKLYLSLARVTSMTPYKQYLRLHLQRRRQVLFIRS